MFAWNSPLNFPHFLISSSDLVGEFQTTLHINSQLTKYFSSFCFSLRSLSWLSRILPFQTSAGPSMTKPYCPAKAFLERGALQYFKPYLGILSFHAEVGLATWKASLLLDFYWRSPEMVLRDQASRGDISVEVFWRWSVNFFAENKFPPCRLYPGEI